MTKTFNALLAIFVLTGLIVGWWASDPRLQRQTYGFFMGLAGYHELTTQDADRTGVSCAKREACYVRYGALSTTVDAELKPVPKGYKEPTAAALESSHHDELPGADRRDAIRLRVLSAARTYKASPCTAAAAIARVRP